MKINLSVLKLALSLLYQNNKTMKNYKIQVWYRYYANGEQEKEFEIFEIVSDSAENALKQALSNFPSHNKIPFKTEILTKK